MATPYRLKLGLEVHAQLLAPQKLFSATPPSFHAPPNSQVSFFDAALPGTQPRLNWSCLNLALRAGIALNSDIAPRFSFDRKHYMYPDQPSGYQITQFREPVARRGYLDLLPRDFTSQSGVRSTQRIRIHQIQMEQDTGKTTYSDGLSLIDLNRANTGLIELVTEPDFTTDEQAVAFIRKLQTLLRRIRVCSGEMETGAMRVDVNVSVADPSGRDLGDRCEIKNLFSTSAVRHAVKVEFRRQCEELKAGRSIERETRGWDGKKTWRLRSKENAMDYRYMPDPDLPQYTVSRQVVEGVRRQLPVFPDVMLDTLLAEPYNVSPVDARTLVELDGGAEFCIAAVRDFLGRGGKPASTQMVSKWLVHRWLGQSAALPQSPQQLVDILLAVDSGRVTTTTGRLLLKHVAHGYTGPIDAIIDEFALEPPANADSSQGAALHEVCVETVQAHPDVVARIKAGKKSSIGFLLGQVMKETQGTFKPADIKSELLLIINS